MALSVKGGYSAIEVILVRLLLLCSVALSGAVWLVRCPTRAESISIMRRPRLRPFYHVLVLVGVLSLSLSVACGGGGDSDELVFDFGDLPEEESAPLPVPTIDVFSRLSDVTSREPPP